MEVSVRTHVVAWWESCCLLTRRETFGAHVEMRRKIYAVLNLLQDISSGRNGSKLPTFRRISYSKYDNTQKKTLKFI